MMAFSESSGNEDALFYLDSTINFLFAIDMILRFFTAYVDDDSLELRDSKIVKLKVLLLTKVMYIGYSYGLFEGLVFHRSHLCHTF